MPLTISLSFLPLIQVLGERPFFLHKTGRKQTPLVDSGATWLDAMQKLGAPDEGSDPVAFWRKVSGANKRLWWGEKVLGKVITNIATE